MVVQTDIIDYQLLTPYGGVIFLFLKMEQFGTEKI